MIALSCALLFIGIAAYVFWFSDDAQPGEQKTRLAFLKERKEVVYENLRDLNFEHKAGKLPEKDYESLRASMEEEAIAILSEIEHLEGSAQVEAHA
jgi:hypothetical protein